MNQIGNRQRTGMLGIIGGRDTENQFNSVQYTVQFNSIRHHCLVVGMVPVCMCIYQSVVVSASEQRGGVVGGGGVRKRPNHRLGKSHVCFV